MADHQSNQTFSGTVTHTGSLLVDTNGVFKGTTQTTSGTVDPLANTELVTVFSGATTLNGISAGVDGQFMILINRSAAALTINHDNAATAADGILLPNSANIATTTYGGLIVVYSSAAAKWIGIKPLDSVA